MQTTKTIRENKSQCQISLTSAQVSVGTPIYIAVSSPACGLFSYCFLHSLCEVHFKGCCSSQEWCQDQHEAPLSLSLYVSVRYFPKGILFLDVDELVKCLPAMHEILCLSSYTKPGNLNTYEVGQKHLEKDKVWLGEVTLVDKIPCCITMRNWIQTPKTYAKLNAIIYFYKYCSSLGEMEAEIKEFLKSGGHTTYCTQGENSKETFCYIR